MRPALPEQTVGLLIKINQEKEFSISANLHRRDLLSKQIHPTGNCGFILTLPENDRLCPGDIVTVLVKEDGTEKKDKTTTIAASIIVQPFNEASPSKLSSISPPSDKSDAKPLKLTFIGHSHIVCMARGADQLGKNFNASINYVQLGGTTFLKNSSLALGDFANYDEEKLQQVLSKITEKASMSVLCPHGNAHNIAALVNYNQPDVLIFKNIEKWMLQYRLMLLALKRYVRSRALVLPAPPPISSDIILETPGTFAEKVTLHGVTPDELRVRAWLHQTRLTQQIATECGLFFFDLPQEVFSDDGLLHKRFQGKDPTHANAAYGELIVRHLVGLLENPDWASTLSYSTRQDKTVNKEKLSKQDRRQHPYVELPERAFWKQAVAEVPIRQFDPVGEVPFRIGCSDKVATAGSCFAQHISKKIRASGFHFLVTENPADNVSGNDETGSFYDFSARYGNIYTARQLVQLFDRAFGYFHPLDDHWLRPDKRLCDPFRPRMEPDGFESVEALVADRQRHLAAVREMFNQLDIFIFTLGLTECWLSRLDGAAYPVAPGVAGGVFDPSRHEFANFTVDEIESDLKIFIRKLRLVNSSAKLILTVSPVPLAATYESSHVLVATTYSKSVLRVAAEAVSRSSENVYYFPSFEIITGSYNRGRYFGQDLRSVTEEGVDHVMSVFMRNLTAGGDTLPLGFEDTATNQIDKHMQEMAVLAQAACDEELLQR
jgi:hypothetical protein